MDVLAGGYSTIPNWLVSVTLAYLLRVYPGKSYFFPWPSHALNAWNHHTSGEFSDDCPSASRFNILVYRGTEFINHDQLAKYMIDICKWACVGAQINRDHLLVQCGCAEEPIYDLLAISRC